MKLIEESIIEEAAKDHINHCILIGEYDRSSLSFKSGCNFTQQQLQPFIVEFVEFCSQKYIMELNGKIWNSTYYLDDMKDYTTQQLLEEFIEFKNKQK